MQKNVFIEKKNNEELVKTLKFHHGLVENIKNACKNKSYKEQKSVHTILTAGYLMKKYKVHSMLQQTFGITHQNRAYQTAVKVVKQQVREFYENDESSRMIKGVSNTVIKGKTKNQRKNGFLLAYVSSYKMI